MSTPQYRPLGFGEILDGAFTLYRRNFVPFLVTALAPTLVMVALFALFGATAFATLGSQDPAAIAGVFGTLMLVILGTSFIYLVMWAALTREASQAYLGLPVSAGDGLRTGGRKLVPLLLSGLAMFVMLIVSYLALALVAGLMVGIGAAVGGVVMVLFSLVGGVVFVAGYLCVFALLFAVLPAIIVENKGPLEAIGRSFDLARGALGRTVGLMLVTLLIVYLPMIAILWLTGGFASITNPGVVPSMGQMLTQQLLGFGVGTLTTPFMAAVIVLLYFDRRVRTEALDVQLMTDRLAAAGA